MYWDRRTWRILAPGILWPLRPTDRLLGLARLAVHAFARTLRNQLGHVGAFGTDGLLTQDGMIPVGGCPRRENRLKTANFTSDIS